MPDVVISGTTGFIGGHVMSAFKAAGLTTATYTEFRDQTTEATTFVHCANIHDSPVENAAYTADVVATVAPRVRRFVNFQTFATLHGVGAIDTGAFNCGKTPVVLAPYPWGKLLQEKTLCREAARHPSLAMRLVYLPSVLGGGSWGRVLTQAQANGVLLPPMMEAAARANAVDADEIAQHLVDTLQDTSPGIRRAILNRTASATATWQDFFRDAKFIGLESSPKAVVKLGVTAAALVAYGVLKRGKPPAIAPGQMDRRPPRPVRAPSQTPTSQVPAGPVHFTGLIQHVVRSQPYIAPRQ